MRAAAVSVAALAAVFLFTPSAEAVPYPDSAFTISPSGAQNCLTLQNGKELDALPCTGAPDQQFTYDTVTKHLANGNGVCARAAGRYGVNLAGAPCSDSKAELVLLEEDTMGSSARQHIKYQSRPGSRVLCFQLLNNGRIGGQGCGQDRQDFTIKPV